MHINFFDNNDFLPSLHVAFISFQQPVRDVALSHIVHVICRRELSHGWIRTRCTWNNVDWSFSQLTEELLYFYSVIQYITSYFTDNFFIIIHIQWKFHFFNKILRMTQNLYCHDICVKICGHLMTRYEITTRQIFHCICKISLEIIVSEISEVILAILLHTAHRRQTS